MFDIGFAELVLVSVVGLLVLGPERLPGAMRAASFWMGRLRRGFDRARGELERELDAAGIKRELHNEAVLRSLEEAGRDARPNPPELPYDTGSIAAGAGREQRAGKPPGASDDKPGA